MNKKIVVACLLSIFLLTNFNVDAVNLKNSDGNTVTITVEKVEMLDYIDGEGDYGAEFCWEIWIIEGVDKDGAGDNYWKYKWPSDDWKEINPNMDHTWNVGNLEEVTIEIKLWDIDTILFVETYEPIDIDDTSKSVYDVKFRYNLKEHVVLSKTFDGSKDGSNEGEQNNDGRIKLEFKDSIVDPPNIFFEPETVDLGSVKPNYHPNGEFYLKNTGELTATGTITYTGDTDEIRVKKGGENFNIKPNGNKYFKVELWADDIGSKSLTITAHGEGDCNDVSITITAECIRAKTVSYEEKSRIKINLILQKLFKESLLICRLLKI